MDGEIRAAGWYNPGPESAPGVSSKYRPTAVLLNQSAKLNGLKSVNCPKTEFARQFCLVIILKTVTNQ